MKEVGVTGFLKEGNIVFVDNPLRKEEFSYYKVNRIDGNKAITNFRKFNRKIYYEKYVYEFGKRQHPVYNNTYVVVDNVLDGVEVL